MDRSLAKTLIIVGSLVMISMAVILSVLQMKIAVYVVGGIWVVGLWILQSFLRCPRCGRFPGRYGFFASYCPHCGEPLD